MLSRAASGVRTRDLWLGKRVLYQLSYCRICYFFQIASFLKAVAKVALFLETPKVLARNFKKKCIFL